MYSTNNTTNNCVITTSTTTQRRCELCDNYNSSWYNFAEKSVPMFLYPSKGNDWHIFCDRHKRQYEIKLNMKLRKEKLEKINGIQNGNMGS